MKRLISTLGALAILATSLFAQQPSQTSRFGGRYDAVKYGSWYTTILTGTSVSGSASIVLASSFVSLPDGTNFSPYNTNAPLLISDGANTETVTPTAVSNCASSALLGQCTITATFAFAHGAGSAILVSSGSFGLQEAINQAVTGGGGIVSISPSWNGTNAILAAASLPPNVTIEDLRNGNAAYWANRPTSLTLLAAPSAPTLTNAATGGSWTAGAVIGAATYIMANGGETLASTDSVATTTSGTTSTITVASPAALAGAVGWRPYISAVGGAAGTEILYSPTAAGCTLTTLETVVPACAIGSNFTATAPVTGTAKEPAQSTAFTAIKPQQFNAIAPAINQTVYGPFAASGVETAGTAYTLSESVIPAGALNFLGKTLRVCGTGVITPVVSSAPTYTLTAATSFGQSPVTLASFVIPATTLTAVSNNLNFCVNIQTAATGTSGTLEVHGSLVESVSSTGAPYAGTNLTDGNTTVSSALDLTKAITLSFVSTPATANITQGQIRLLTMEYLN